MVEENKIEPPTVIVIGDVVKLREKLNGLKHDLYSDNEL
jgi:siroheme synthase